MTANITPLYAGLLGLLLVVLAVDVIRARWATQVALGDGGHQLLIRRIRVHANFIEYVPLILLLMLLAEAQSAPAWVLHGLGMTIVTGRLSHAWGVRREPEYLAFRSAGMTMTLTALIIASALNIALATGTGG